MSGSLVGVCVIRATAVATRPTVRVSPGGTVTLNSLRPRSIVYWVIPGEEISTSRTTIGTFARFVTCTSIETPVVDDDPKKIGPACRTLISGWAMFAGRSELDPLAQATVKRRAERRA